MGRNLYFAFSLLVCAGVLLAEMTGYELGDDASSGGSQQGASHFHK